MMESGATLLISHIQTPCYEEHKLTDGTTKRVMGVIKNVPMHTRLALQGTHDRRSVDFYNFKLRCSLLYDCENERAVDFVQSKPLSWVLQANESGDGADVEVRILVLSSQHEDLFFRVKYMLMPPNDSPFSPLTVVSEPIRVVSKQAQLRPIGTPAALHGVKGKGRKRTRPVDRPTGTATAKKGAHAQNKQQTDTTSNESTTEPRAKRSRIEQPQQPPQGGGIPIQPRPPSPVVVGIAEQVAHMAALLRDLLASFNQIPEVQQRERMDQVLRLCSNEQLAPLTQFLNTLNLLHFVQRSPPPPPPPGDQQQQQQQVPIAMSPLDNIPSESAGSSDYSEYITSDPSTPEAQQYAPCGPTQLNPEFFGAQPSPYYHPTADIMQNPSGGCWDQHHRTNHDLSNSCSLGLTQPISPFAVMDTAIHRNNNNISEHASLSISLSGGGVPTLLPSLPPEELYSNAQKQSFYQQHQQQPVPSIPILLEPLKSYRHRPQQQQQQTTFMSLPCDPVTTLPTYSPSTTTTYAPVMTGTDVTSLSLSNGGDSNASLGYSASTLLEYLMSDFVPPMSKTTFVPTHHARDVSVSHTTGSAYSAAASPFGVAHTAAGGGGSRPCY